MAEEPVSIIEAAEGSEKKVPTFEMLAYTGKPMQVSDWSLPVVIDLEGLAMPTQSVSIRRNHRSDQMVGHTTAITLKDGKLRASGVVSFENQHAREIVASSKNGFPWQASVGVAAERVEFLPEKTETKVNGRTVKGPMDIVRAGMLREISFVDLGADRDTEATVAAAERQDKNMADEQDKGGAGAASGNDKGTNGAVGGAAPEKPAKEVQAASGDTSKVLKAVRAENERKAKITELVAEAAEGAGPDLLEDLEKISAEAVSKDWGVETTENKILRAQMLARERDRGTVPAIHSGRSTPPTTEVLAAALLMSCGVKDEKLVKDRDIGERAVETAYKRHRGFTLHQLMAAALEGEGIRAPHGGQALYTAVMERWVRAGFSTINLPGILGVAGNKLLLEAFTSVEAVYPLIAQQVDLSNFNTWTSYRLSNTGTFAVVAPDGKIAHGTLSEESYTNRLETRGQMLTIPRQAIINDDLNAMNSLFAQLGRKAVIALERALFDAIMESSDVFYTSARGNRATSAALSLTTLGAGEAAMMGQLDNDSEPIYARPKYLLVPPGLRALAETIYTSATVVGGSSNVPVDNNYRGRYLPVSSPYLGLTALAGSSATTWYLVADPNMIPAFQVGFLQGKRQPTAETADADFNTLGIQLRCYFDFGVAQMDYRGAYKATA